MPKITWLGDVDTPGTTEPDAFCVWNEITFPVGVPVEVDDAHMIGKAKHNRFFRLEPPPQGTVFGPLPEMWTETAPEDAMAFEAMEPPKRKRGRPPKVREPADGQ